MHIFVLTATYELRVSRKSHFRDHPTANQKRRMTPPLRRQGRLNAAIQDSQGWKERSQLDRTIAEKDGTF
jgi:hypothetical protein